MIDTAICVKMLERFCCRFLVVQLDSEELSGLLQSEQLTRGLQAASRVRAGLPAPLAVLAVLAEAFLLWIRPDKTGYLCVFIGSYYYCIHFGSRYQ